MADYPAQLERRRVLADGRGVLIRPIRANDEPREHEFLDGLSGDTQRRRFIRYAMPRGDALVHFFTHIDYDRHMAFVCEATVDGAPHIVGDARYVANADGRSCEFGVVVADDWHHTGIAQLLMSELMREARRRGFETMEGLVLSDNADMIGFVSALGFSVSEAPQDPALVRVVKRL
ncbi:MAG TPA: GNAT family N-acetyltransferase [Burkholderiales bacterium]|nr:GNAT family N-acetyltransferase [Burkholderiales bacterium]